MNETGFSNIHNLVNNHHLIYETMSLESADCEDTTPRLIDLK